MIPRICETCDERPAKKGRNRCHTCEKLTRDCANPTRPDLTKPSEHVLRLSREIARREREGTLDEGPVTVAKVKRLYPRKVR